MPPLEKGGIFSAFETSPRTARVIKSMVILLSTAKMIRGEERTRRATHRLTVLSFTGITARILVGAQSCVQSESRTTIP